MDAAQKRRRVTKLRLARLRDQILALTKYKTLDIENLSKLEAVMFDYRTIKDTYEGETEEILLLMNENDENYAENSNKLLRELDEVKDVGFTCEGKIKAFHKLLSTQESRTSLVPNAVDLNASFRAPSTSSTQPKLERISIPSFDGDILNFHSFRGLFENLVHNNTELSNVQKLYYLKQALTGSAREMIRNFELEEASYAQAWSYILSRFDNKRAVVRALFRKLHSIKRIKSDNQIRSLLDEIDVILLGIKATGEEINNTFSRYIAYHATLCLDEVTAIDWEHSISSTDNYPTFAELQKFLQTRAFAIEDRKADANSQKKEQLSNPPKKLFTTVGKVVEKAKPKCVVCNQLHFLFQCKDFSSKKPEERFEIVKKHKLCIMCFNPHHSVSQCHSRPCPRCGNRHNSLLHFDPKGKVGTEEISASSPASKFAQSNNFVENKHSNSFAGNCSTDIISLSSLCNSRDEHQNKIIVLPSAVVKFKCGSIYGKARILLDSCSQPTIVSDTFVKKFRLPINKSVNTTSIKGVGLKPYFTNDSVNITLVSRVEPFELDIEADVVPESAMSYKVNFVQTSAFNYRLKNLQLADPEIYQQKTSIESVDIILSAEFYEQCNRNETLNVEDINLRLTRFGWTIIGAFYSKPSIFKNSCFTACTTFEIDQNLRKFWEVEEIVQQKASSTEIERCNEHFEKNVSRADNGKFVVRLPFKEDRALVTTNRQRALSSIFRAENKLDKPIKFAYKKFLEEYESLGHMSVAQPTKDTTYYIPHRAVIRADSTTTPLRVVFNASSKGKGEKSLNDLLMIGPSIQRDLFSILLDMRKHTIAFSADIEKMYRMIFVHPDDRNMQRIFWRSSEHDPIREYTLNTVTYGTAPAAFLATKCLNKIAEEIQTSQPKVAETIKNNLYMDDLIAGASSEEEVLKLQKGIHKALNEYGFRLRKYSSNSIKLINSLHPDLLASRLDQTLNHSTSLLGLNWHSEADNIQMKLQIEPLPDEVTPTKRIILSFISRVFDPIGFFAPVLIRGKLIVQTLWLESKSWDEPVSDVLSEIFKVFYHDLANLSFWQIPRAYFENASEKIPKCQIVAFSDASEKAYCVVVYLRHINKCGKVECSFVCSKSRVAPLKTLTIPRLELLAASLLVDVVLKITNIFRIDLNNVYAFTDSTVVLCWLSQLASSFKVFVSNRVEKITNVIPFSRWNYVNSENNPADYGTRGFSADKFLKKKSWFLGPEFLYKADPFKHFIIPNIDQQNQLEKRKVNVSSFNIVKTTALPIDKISSYRRLINITAYVFRFYLCCKTKRKPLSNHLSFEEIENAHHVIIRCTQFLYYSVEIEMLRNNVNNLKKKSSLLSLSPFLDSHGILRVGGRLDKSSFSFDKKHPIILYAKSNFCQVYVRYIHEKYFHANRSFLTSYFSSLIWFVGGRTNLFKQVIRSCVICTRFRAKTMSQIMSYLPSPRITINFPFTHTGIDFAGPLAAKCVRHRTVKNMKIYAALFVCLTTRAVHIEAVSDLSTDRFIASLQRFISRRGVPSNIYSDNGTNFQGSSSFFECSTAKEKIIEFANTESFRWTFIPAYTPHQGGIWESAVKSAKFHLKRVTNGHSLDFEEYSTLLSRIEAVLNSRPLCYVKNHEQGEEVLTPSHFLICRSLTAMPKLENLDIDIAPSKRAQLIKSQLLSFWNQWSKDYIAQMQTRNKWKSIQPNLEIGTIVFVKEPNSPPFQWPLGIVESTYPDADGNVRRAEIRMKNSVKLRSICSLVPLPQDKFKDETSVSSRGAC